MAYLNDPLAIRSWNPSECNGGGEFSLLGPEQQQQRIWHSIWLRQQHEQCRDHRRTLKQEHKSYTAAASYCCAEFLAIGLLRTTAVASWQLSRADGRTGVCQR